MLIYSFYYQVAVDIFKGIQDKDARYLAEKLEFKGPQLEQVSLLRQSVPFMHSFLPPQERKLSFVPIKSVLVTLQGSM